MCNPPASLEYDISDRLPLVELRVDAAAQLTDREVVRHLAAMLGSPYLDLGKKVVLLGTGSNSKCAVTADAPVHEGIPIAVRSLLSALSEAEGRVPESANVSLLDDYLNEGGTDHVLHAASAAMKPGSPRIIHLHEGNKPCVTLSPGGLWWWAMRLLLGGPSETYHREYHLASHRFVESTVGLNRLADLRLFLPTSHGLAARTEVVSNPEIIAVPQSMYPALGRMLPEAQPYLLPVFAESLNVGAILVDRGQLAGTVVEIDPGELRAIRRGWSATRRRRSIAGMRFRAAINRLLAILFSNRLIADMLRVPSRRFHRLSRAIQRALSTSGRYPLQNPYLSRAERELLADRTAAGS